MALSIKSDKADRLARELAALTGESITDAVVAALEGRLEDERRRRRPPERRPERGPRGRHPYRRGTAPEGRYTKKVCVQRLIPSPHSTPASLSQEFKVRGSSEVRALTMVVVLLGLFMANACSDDKVTLPDERSDIPLDTVPTSGFPGNGVDAGATAGENSEFCDLLAGLDMRTADVTTDAQFAMLQSKLRTVETAAPPSARDMAETWSSTMAGIASDAQATGTAVPVAVERALRRNNVLIEADRALAGWLDRNCATTTGS